MPADSASQDFMKEEEDRGEGNGETTLGVGVGVGTATVVGDLIMDAGAAEEDADWGQSQLSQISQVSLASQMSTGAMLSSLGDFEPGACPTSK
jgi:hypothetical protein